MQQWALIIEDDTVINEFLNSVLTDIGMRCSITTTVSDAIKKLKSQKYGVIIVDLHVGKEDGKVVIAARETEVTPNKDTPVLVMSGTFEPEVLGKLQGMIAGAFVKPFNRQALVAKLQSIGVIAKS